MKTIVQDLAVEYEDEGQGPVLVLLHGWKDTLHTFDALTERLARHFRVVRLDLPGFGNSEAPSHAWGVGDYAQFVADFIEKLNIRPMALIGHSFGGRVTIKGTADGVLTTEKLVLIAAAGVSRRRTVRNRVYALAAKAGNALTHIPPLDRFRGVLRKKLYTAADSDYYPAGEMRATFLRTVREDLGAAACTIRIPALIVWGSGDTITPPEDGKRLSRFIGTSTLRVLPGGHFIHQEKPDEVAALITEFLA